MQPSLDTTSTQVHRPRRTVWRRVWRAAVALILIAGAGTVLLPWIVPTDWVRAEIEAAIAAKTGHPVRVGEISLGWAEGVVIRDIELDDATEVVLRVGMVRSEFSPWSWLWGHAGQVRIEGVDVSLRRDQDGEWNIASLLGGFMPSDSPSDPPITIDSVHVGRSRVTVQTAQMASAMVVSVQDVQWSTQDGELTQVVLNAALQQVQNAAPITLRFDVLPRGGTRIADAEFHFYNLDLEQLPHLPAEHLEAIEGICRGRIQFGVHRDLRVDGLKISVHASGLDIDPAGELDLPEFDQAGLDVTASLDPLTQEVTFNDLVLVLPGLSVQGQGRFFPGVLTGRLADIDSLELRGIGEPDVLMKLLTGDASLGGGVTVSGPVSISTTWDRSGQDATIALHADATKAVMQIDSRVVKPAGRSATLDLAGQMDMDTETANVANIRAVLGDNALEGEGFSLAASLIPERTPATVADAVAAVLDGLDRVKGQGTATVRDWASIRDVLPVNAQHYCDATGSIQLQWTLRGEPKSPFQLTLDVPADASLRLGDWRKPPRQPMRVTLASAYDDETLQLSNVKAEAQVGESRMGIVGGTVSLIPATSSSSEDAKMVFSCDLVARGLEGFQGPLAARTKASGNVSGHIEGRVGPKRATAKLELDLAEASLRAGEFWNQPAGGSQTVLLAVEVTGEPMDPRQVNATVTLPWATGDLAASVQKGQWTDATVTLAGRVDRLVDRCPMLQRHLDGKTLAGQAKLVVSGEGLSEDVIRWSAGLDVTDGVLSRIEPAGVLFSSGKAGAKLSARGTLDRKRARVQVTQSRATLGKTTVALEGPVTLALDASTDWRQWLVAIDGRLSGKVDVFNLPLKFPLWSKRYKISEQPTGQIVLAGRVNRASHQTTMNVSADATNVAWRDARGSNKAKGESLVITATGQLVDESNAESKISLAIRSKANHFTGQAVGAITWSRAGSPIGGEGVSVSAKWTLADASWAERLLPACRLKQMTGDLTGSAQWTAQEGVSGSVTASKLTAMLGTARVGLDGSVSVSDIIWDGRNHEASGRVVANRVQWTVGKSGGYVVGDVTLAANTPTGRLDLLCDRIDVPQLQAVLGEFADASQSTPAPTGKLTEAEAKAAMAEADAEITKLRKLLKKADFRVLASMKRVHIHDAGLNQDYDLLAMTAKMTASGGKLELSYTGGLNGGVYRSKVGCDVLAERPMVTSSLAMKDVLARANVQAHILAAFPGNTVKGSFSRTEDVSISLRRLLANRADSRVPAIRVGKSRLDAIRGVVEAGAAPKFVTAMFPGLDTAYYHYNTMTNYTDLLPDGTSKNEAIFFGLYNVYMEGVTKPDGSMDYTLGVILVGITADWQRDWKQFRVPLVKLGRTSDADASMRTSYPWPNETLGRILIRDNPAYRAWVLEKARQDAAAEANGKKETP